MRKTGYWCGSTLLLILCCGGRFIGALAEAQEAFERTIEASLDYNDVSRVDVQLDDGSLVVQAWDSWRVALETQCSISGVEPGAAEGYLEQIEIRSQFRDQIASFDLTPPAHETLLHPPQWQHTLYLPSEAISSLRIRQKSGTVQLLGMQGIWDVQLDNGSIDLLEVTGEFHVSTKKGDIVGQIQLSGESGFEAKQGTIQLTFLDSLPQPTTFTVGSGDVVLILPEDYPASLDAQTNQGRIQNALALLSVEQETPQRLQAVLAQEGPPLRIRVDDGNIELWEINAPPEEWDVLVVPDDSLPTLQIPITQLVPQIDGMLNEPIWRHATRTTDFYVADGTQRAEVQTEAYLARDEGHLYLAARVHEPEPDTIHVSQVNRDGPMGQDDSIEWWLVPTEGVAYTLQINALGTLADRRVITTAQDNTSAPPQDSDWNPAIQIQTSYTNDAWTLELALPLSELESDDNVWGFNVHRYRSATGTYSSWIPRQGESGTSGSGGIGLIEFTDISEAERWKLEQVKVEGVSQLSSEWILNYLQLDKVDEVLSQELPEIEQMLRDSGLFKDVRLSFRPGDDGVVLDVQVEEEELLQPEGVNITGNSVFPNSFLLTRFGWQHPRIAPARFWDIQCHILENLYHAQGYSLTAVSWAFADGRISVNIDEGHLDAILILGTERISERLIRAQLGLSQTEPYRQTVADERKRALLEYLQSYPEFEALEEWKLVSDAGQHVLLIQIRERTGIDENLAPIVNFNRVQGLILGGQAELRTRKPEEEAAFGSLSYGFSNERWNYLVGFRKTWFKQHQATFGLHFHSLTDTPDFGLVSPNEEFLGALLWGAAYLDYYQREGLTVWYHQRLTPSTAFEIEWSEDDHQYLIKSTDWSLFRRDYPKRSNQRIWQGESHTLRFTYSFDSRDVKGRTKRYFRSLPVPDSGTTTGWLGYLRYEKAGGWLDGDFEYEKGEFLVTRYYRLAEDIDVDLRFMGTFTNETLPPQRRAYLGGIGTLRGYAFKELVGDNMLLINMDWRWWFSSRRALAFFVDSGYVWQHKGEFHPEDTRTAVGVGFVAGNLLRLDLAQPLESGRDPELLLRLDRMF